MSRHPIMAMRRRLDLDPAVGPAVAVSIGDQVANDLPESERVRHRHHQLATAFHAVPLSDATSRVTATTSIG